MTLDQQAYEIFQCLYTLFSFQRNLSQFRYTFRIVFAFIDLQSIISEFSDCLSILLFMFCFVLL